MSIRQTFLHTAVYLCLASTAFSKSQLDASHITSFVESQFANGKPEEACKFLDHLEKEYVPEALYLKGVLILNGVYNGGVRNPREASIYFAKAAALKYAPAIAALGDSYLDGDGTEKNEKEAFRLYKQAADLGNGAAQFNVAILYRDGIGTKQSQKMALKYMRMAAKNKELVEIHEDAHVIINEILDELALKYMHMAAKNKKPVETKKNANVVIDKIIDEMKKP
ncbi:MAG: tetratricopeptide repeat protein [Pseudomonadota bacterium]